MKFDQVELDKLDITVIDGDRGKNYPHKDELLNTGYCLFLSANNVTKNGFEFSNNVYITKEKDDALHNGRLSRNDIVITTRGTVGNVGIYDETIKFEHMRINSGMLIVRCGQNIDNRFLYNVLRSKDFASQIDSIRTGSAQPQLPKSHFLKMVVPSIPLHFQRRIANILGALDDKIALNQQINRNLEEQAQAIFDSYFITDNLFETMKKLPLSDLCTTITKGTTPTTLGKPFVDSGINFIKAESILDNHSIDTAKFAFIDDDTNQQLKRSIIHDKDILFTIAGTLGRFAFVDNAVLPANTNQAVAIIRTNAEKITPEYLYSFFIGNWHNDYYTKRIQQAVQANLSLTTIKSLPIPILPTDSMKKYLSVITPLIAMIKHNEKENRLLISTRDALLPRLMSGEIDVSKIDINI